MFSGMSHLFADRKSNVTTAIYKHAQPCMVQWNPIIGSPMGKNNMTVLTGWPY